MPRFKIIVWSVLATMAVWNTAALVPAPSAAQETLTVNSERDATDAAPGDGVCEAAPGTGECTLRAAIQEANSLTGPQIVDLAAGTYVLSLQGSDDDTDATGDLDITDDLRLQGVGSEDAVIDGAQIDRVIDTAWGVRLSLHRLAIRGGMTDDQGGGIRSWGSLEVHETIVADCKALKGGAIFAVGPLEVVSSTIQANTALQGGGLNAMDVLRVVGSELVGNGSTTGGGVRAVGETLIDLSTFEANSAVGGGGIAQSEGALVVRRSSFVGNSATGGGAIDSSVDSLVDRCSFVENSATSGGAIDFHAYMNRPTEPELNVTSSTFSRNGATVGAALFATGGSAWISSCTIADHRMKDGVLRAPAVEATDTIVTLRNSIVSDSCSFRHDEIVTEGHNLGADQTCGIGSADGDIVADPGLGPLQDNGGPTWTHGLSSVSPAIDAGSVDCLAMDQRGYTRPHGDACDIGAVEHGASPGVDPPPTSWPTGEMPVQWTPTPTNMPTTSPVPTQAQPTPTQLPKGALERVGHMGGTARAVAYAGGYAYVATGPALVIVDLSDPAEPVPVGKIDLPVLLRDVAVAGGIAFVRAPGTLYLVDVSDPRQPRHLSTLLIEPARDAYDRPASNPDTYGSVAARGSVAYVSVVDAGIGISTRGLVRLLVADVSDADSPVWAGEYSRDYGSMVHPNDIALLETAVVDNTVIMAVGGRSRPAQLLAVDVSDMSSPTELDLFEHAEKLHAATVSGDRAVLALDGPQASPGQPQPQALHVVDVSDPAHMTEVGSKALDCEVEDIASNDRRAVVACLHAPMWEELPHTLHAVDVDEIAVGPGTPVRRIGALAVTGDRILAARVPGGMAVLELSDSDHSPTRVGEWRQPGDIGAVAVSTGTAYLAPAGCTRERMSQHGYSAGDDLHVADVHQPASPRHLASWSAGWSVSELDLSSCAFDTLGRRDVEVRDGHAYLATYEKGLQIVDVRDRAAPVSAGELVTNAAVTGVAVSGDHALVASRGLHVLDVSDPGRPTRVGTGPSNPELWKVAAAGGLAVASGRDGMHVYDVAEPTRPRVLSEWLGDRYPPAQQVWNDIAVAGDMAYLVRFSLMAFHISDPAQPRLVGDTVDIVPTGLMSARAVAIAGSHAYVAGRGGLWVFDIADPAHMSLAGFHETPGVPQGVAVDGENVYLADSDGGLVVFRHPALSERLYLPAVVRSYSPSPGSRLPVSSSPGASSPGSSSLSRSS